MFSILCRAASGRPHESTSVSCHEQDTAQNALLMNHDISMIVRFLCFSRFYHHRVRLDRTWGEEPTALRWRNQPVMSEEDPAVHV